MTDGKVLNFDWLVRNLYFWLSDVNFGLYTNDVFFLFDFFTKLTLESGLICEDSWTWEH